MHHTHDDDKKLYMYVYILKAITDRGQLCIQWTTTTFVDYDDDVDVEGGGTIKSWKIVKISHA